MKSEGFRECWWTQESAQMWVSRSSGMCWMLELGLPVIPLAVGAMFFVRRSQQDYSYGQAPSAGMTQGVASSRLPCSNSV